MKLLLKKRWRRSFQASCKAQYHHIAEVTMHTQITLLICLLASMLTGCLNVKQQSSELMTEGKARNVPLLIYDTSWNDPHALYNTRMAVGLLNPSDEKINSVTLRMANCGSKGITEYTQALNLGGPFLPGKFYVIHPSWLVQYSQWISREATEAAAKTSSHMVIKGVEIIDNNDKKYIYNKDVSKLLTSNISNFCLNSIF